MEKNYSFQIWQSFKNMIDIFYFHILVSCLWMNILWINIQINKTYFYQRFVFLCMYVQLIRRKNKILSLILFFLQMNQTQKFLADVGHCELYVSFAGIEILSSSRKLDEKFFFFSACTWAAYEFCPISGDREVVGIPNWERIFLMKCYWILQNIRVTAFIVSELILKN